VSKNLGAWARFGGLCPWLQRRTATVCSPVLHLYFKNFSPLDFPATERDPSRSSVSITPENRGCTRPCYIWTGYGVGGSVSFCLGVYLSSSIRPLKNLQSKQYRRPYSGRIKYDRRPPRPLCVFRPVVATARRSQPSCERDTFDVLYYEGG